MTFLEEVRYWQNTDNVPSRAEAEAYCLQLARTHYENFPIVSWLLPKRLHQDFFNVYAFCRWSDDLGDEVGSSELALELLQWWRTELNDCFAGRVRHPVFVALAGTIERHHFSIAPFQDLISAFEQDQCITQYESYEQLLDYCQRSANPVGRIVLRLGECDTPENVNWSDSICTGLQLANFWQDVARDDAIGRVYLPRDDRERFGYSEDQRALRRTTPEFVKLLKFEVDRARDCLESGRPLITAVPSWLQVDIELFLEGGLRILKEIETIQYRVWERRPVVSKRAAFGLLIRGVWHWAVRW